ncbi:MAG: hypothetical protein ACRDYC_02260, partial [Acidimicrobiales bacterium]
MQLTLTDSRTLRNALKAPSLVFAGPAATRAVTLSADDAGVLTVTAHGDNTTVSVTIPTASCTERGDFTTNATDLKKALAIASGACTITAKADGLQLDWGSISTGIVALDYASSLDPVPLAAEFEAVDLVADHLRSALRQVLPAVMTDETRPILACAIFEGTEDGYRVVGTDSYRLAMRDVPGGGAIPAGMTFLAPRLALLALVELIGPKPCAGVTLRRSGRQLSFTAPGWRIETVGADGDFPNYRQLIPTALPIVFATDPTEPGRLASQVRTLAKALGSKSKAHVACTFGPTGVHLQVSGEVESQTAAGGALVSGDLAEIAFRPAYLADGLEALEGICTKIA